MCAYRERSCGGARIGPFMRLSRLFLAWLVCLVCVAQSPAASRKTLQKRIAAVLSRPELERGYWGMEVISLASGKVLYEQNSDKLFIPASNTKLFTTAAALALIGPDHRFVTTVETGNQIDANGRMTGDLRLVGRGDPNLSGRVLPYASQSKRGDNPVRALEDLADTVVHKGLKSVSGDIIGDDTYFADERYDEGWSWDDLMWSDGAPVSALTINDNVLFLNVAPGAHVGDRAVISVKPFADYYNYDNRLVTASAGTARNLAMDRPPGSMTVSLWGSIPLGDAGVDEALALDDPAEFAAILFRQMLVSRGVAVNGKARALHSERAGLATIKTQTPAQVQVLAGHESAPLVEDVHVINKVSQNLHAEILLRLLGRQQSVPGTVEGGLAQLKSFLAQAGVPDGEYAFHDGSGLSRQNLVTPHAVVQLLRYAATQPWGASYRDSLPVAGVDGTLADRLNNRDPRAHVFAKTGSLGGVRTLSGYATTVKGEPVAFSIFANNFIPANSPGSSVKDRSVTDAMDEIVEEIVK